ncbi:MAG: DUF3160 domain-containing protein [candidate division WOR-3 bacterium]
MKRIALLLIAVAVAIAGTGKIKVENPDLLGRLGLGEREILAKQGMVARLSNCDQIYDIYSSAAKENLPLLVTPDPCLHAFHVLFDYTLRIVELNHFYPTLQVFLETVLAKELAQYKSNSDPKLKQALKANIAFLSVPLSYLKPEFKVPDMVKDLVEQERSLIEAHAGFGRSAVLGIKEDFSQYIPRGHYTRNEKFQNYFKAMMFLGRMCFYLKPPDDPQLGLSLTRQALLLASAISTARTASDEPAQELWQRIMSPLTFLVGQPDDIMPPDYLKLAQELCRGMPLERWLASDEELRTFIAKAEKLPNPRILSTFLWDTAGGLPRVKGMRVMGQRFIPDSYVFQELVYDRVGTRQEPRTMPMGLDVMAALGSDRARDYLINLYHQDRFQNYLARLDSLRAAFNRFDARDWHQNAYYNWLYLLRLNLMPILPQRNSILARFVTAVAYPDKTLVTSSGSWAELRHDTILYAKQSYTVFTGAAHIEPSPPPPIAYVEPRPELFAELGQLAERITRELKFNGLPVSEDVNSRLKRFADACDRLHNLAKKELAGKPLNEEDARYCQGLGRLLADLTEFPSDDTREFTSAADQKMALVADVHTDPNRQQVLEVAVGNPCELYAVIPWQGRDYLAIGGCFSYYEFTRPMSQRMTDEEWQALKPRPALPEWTKSFIAQ